MTSLIGGLFHCQKPQTLKQKIKNPPSPYPDNDVEAEGNTWEGNVG
jgi:DNA-binding protein H-NS